VQLLWLVYGKGTVSDSAYIARTFYQIEERNILSAISRTSNGKRLLSLPELGDDVAFCARLNVFPIVAALCEDSSIRRR
jgi:phosphosulfolactate phosphohydrolase-like enzyme